MGWGVPGREAVTRATTERMDSASAVRERSGRAALVASNVRQQQLDAHRASAYRIELEASPMRVHQLKKVEAERKAGITDGLRRQYRALEVRAAPPSPAPPAPAAPSAHARPRARGARAGIGPRQAVERRRVSPAHA